MAQKLTEPLLTAYKKIENLQKHNRYLGAYIFGSIARGEQDKNSDLDAIVLVDHDNNCKEVNHPIINGIKVDISFRSLEQVKKTEEDILKKGGRIPWISESIIVFDKTGKLTKYKLWSRILVLVAKPIGGRKEISEINCHCEVCKKDLALLTV